MRNFKIFLSAFAVGLFVGCCKAEADSPLGPDPVGAEDSRLPASLEVSCDSPFSVLDCFVYDASGDLEFSTCASVPAARSAVTSRVPARASAPPFAKASAKASPRAFALPSAKASARALAPPSAPSRAVLALSRVPLKSTAKTRRLTLPLELTPGDKTIAVIADSPLEFNPAALTRLETLESLTYSELQDNPLSPVCCGILETNFTPDSPDLSLTLRRALSRIEVGEISNPTGDVMLRPVLRLEDRAAYCEVFRTSGFNPTEFSSDTSGLHGRVWEEIPDIGPAGVYAGISLWCYPNASVDRPTRLVLEWGPANLRRTRSVELSVPECDSQLLARIL